MTNLLVIIKERAKDDVVILKAVMLHLRLVLEHHSGWNLVFDSTHPDTGIYSRSFRISYNFTFKYLI
jgi:hypothetical protein